MYLMPLIFSFFSFLLPGLCIIKTFMTGILCIEFKCVFRSLRLYLIAV